MTLILGIQCREGIVIGADSMITAGSLHGNVRLDDIKVHLPGERGIVAFAGDVGAGQAVLDDLKEHWPAILDAGSRKEVKRLITESVSDALGNALAPDKRPSFSGIVAVTIQNQPTLMLFREDPPAIEARDRIYFLTAGSGQHFAFLFLKFLERIFWNNGGPSSISDGILSAMWTLQHIIDANATLGVGGTPCIAVLEDRRNTGDWQSRILSEAESGEYREQIYTIESAMRQVKENWSQP